MRLVAATALAALALVAAGCNPTCQSTCRRYYEPDQCDAAPQGLPLEDAVLQCQRQCQRALQVAGEDPLPTDPKFSPNLLSPPTPSPQLTNEREASAWMDCVWSFDDDECPARLGDQYCVRVFGDPDF